MLLDVAAEIGRVRMLPGCLDQRLGSVDPGPFGGPGTLRGGRTRPGAGQQECRRSEEPQPAGAKRAWFQRLPDGSRPPQDARGLNRFASSAA